MCRNQTSQAVLEDTPQQHVNEETSAPVSADVLDRIGNAVQAFLTALRG